MKKLILHAVSIVLLSLIIHGCINYKKVEFKDQNKVLSQKEVKEKFSSYSVYVKDNDRTYKLKNPKIIDDKISGEIELVNDGISPLLKDGEVKIKNKDDNKYDMVIYTKPNTLSANNDNNIFSEHSYLADLDSASNITTSETNNSNYISIDKEDIERVSMFAVNENSVGMIVLFIVLGALALTLLIWGMVAMSNQATTNSGNASGTSSGNSNSNSNSGNSSGNGTGGGSSSGCYVATMVYGSYEAPEVLVLRKFRDQFLAKHYLGRKFILFYYKNSPKFVAKHQNNKSVHKPIKYILNKFVKLLSRKYS